MLMDTLGQEPRRGHSEDVSRCLKPQLRNQSVGGTGQPCGIIWRHPQAHLLVDAGCWLGPPLVYYPEHLQEPLQEVSPCGVIWASSHPGIGPPEKTQVCANITLQPQGSQSITSAVISGWKQSQRYAQIHGDRT